MAFIGNFDAETVAPKTEYTALPSGEYLMAITDSEMKSTKNGDGQYLQLVFTVLNAQAPAFIERKVFVRLNLINNNQTAVDIAQRELSAICHALGILKITDSIQLHDRPMTCSVKYQPAKGEYSEGNKIAGYKPASAYGQGKGFTPASPVAPRPNPTPPPHSPAPAVAAAVPQEPVKVAAAVPPWRQKPASPAPAVAA